MRAGILPQITANGFVNPINSQDTPRPPTQLGTDGLAAMIKSSKEPVTRIGDTWTGAPPRPNDNEFKQSPAFPSQALSPALSSSSSSDSSIGD